MAAMLNVARRQLASVRSRVCVRLLEARGPRSRVEPHGHQPTDLIGIRLFDQGSSPLSWLRSHIKFKIRLTPSAAENCRTQNGIRHIDVNRQNYT